MSMKSITFKNNAIKRFYALFLAFVVAIILVYFLFPESVIAASIGAGIYVLYMATFQIRKYVFTADNTIEFYHLFGKMKSRTVDIDAILEMRVEKMNLLRLRYTKKGYSQPTSAPLVLNDQDMKNAQHELLKRNPKISLD